MIYVGIDIVKFNQFASILSSDGEVLAEPFKFTNDNDGFHKLILALDSFKKDSLIIALESILTTAITLLKTSFAAITRYAFWIRSKLHLYARITSAKRRRIQSHRFYTSYHIDIMHLKNLDRSHAKIHLTSYLDQAFLELQYFFGEIHRKILGRYNIVVIPMFID